MGGSFGDTEVPKGAGTPPVDPNPPDKFATGGAVKAGGVFCIAGAFDDIGVPNVAGGVFGGKGVPKGGGRPVLDPKPPDGFAGGGGVNAGGTFDAGLAAGGGVKAGGAFAVGLGAELPKGAGMPADGPKPPD